MLALYYPVFIISCYHIFSFFRVALLLELVLELVLVLKCDTLSKLHCNRLSHKIVSGRFIWRFYHLNPAVENSTIIKQIINKIIANINA